MSGKNERKKIVSTISMEISSMLVFPFIFSHVVSFFAMHERDKRPEYPEAITKCVPLRSSYKRKCRSLKSSFTFKISNESDVRQNIIKPQKNN